MTVDFSGDVARLYADYRRDLPAEQAADLAALLGLTARDTILDLGCGTGQLAVPLRKHCAQVVAVDPEPLMLAGLAARGVDGIQPRLGSDADLPALTGLGAVVIGNALHWMDEPVVLAAAVGMVRGGGGVAVVTQGPPLWLGESPWQLRVRAILESAFGPVGGGCGSGEADLERRASYLSGLTVQTRQWSKSYPVTPDWVIGHLGSCLTPAQLASPAWHRATVALAELDDDLVESVSTTALTVRR